MKIALHLLTALALVTAPHAGAEHPDLTYRAPTPETPTTVHWCASLLSNQGLERPKLSELGLRLRGLMARAGELFAGRDAFDFRSTLARVSVDLARSGDRHFAVNQILVGEDAIRNNLNAVAAEAARRDREYDRVAAHLPFPSERRTMAHAGRALLMTALAGAFFTVSNYLYLHDHKLAAGVWTLASAYTLFGHAVTPIRAMFDQLVNEAVVRGEGRVGPNRKARASIIADTRGPRFADAVLAALDEGGDVRRPIFTRYAVALPMSLSTAPLAYGERSAPSADAITDAMRTSGNFSLPRDYRRLSATHVYYFDEVEGQPVLITTVVERRSSTDWKR